MNHNEEWMNTILLIVKERSLLNEIIVWLRAKGLWQKCKKDLISFGIKDDNSEETESDESDESDESEESED